MEPFQTALEPLERIVKEECCTRKINLKNSTDHLLLNSDQTTVCVQSEASSVPLQHRKFTGATQFLFSGINKVINSIKSIETQNSNNTLCSKQEKKRVCASDSRNTKKIYCALCIYCVSRLDRQSNPEGLLIDFLV